MPLIVVFGSVLFLIWLAQEMRNGKGAIKATYAWCDAGDDITSWRFENPNMGIADSPKACQLVKREIEAWEWFLKTHPCIKRDDKYVTFLNSFLDERAPLHRSSPPLRRHSKRRQRIYKPL